MDFKSFRQEAKLTVFDVPVVVGFYHYPAIESTEWEEGVPEDLEIDSVEVDEICILRLCGEFAMSELYKQLYGLIDKQKEVV